MAGKGKFPLITLTMFIKKMKNVSLFVIINYQDSSIIKKILAPSDLMFCKQSHVEIFEVHKNHKILGKTEGICRQILTLNHYINLKNVVHMSCKQFFILLKTLRPLTVFVDCSVSCHGNSFNLVCFLRQCKFSAKVNAL